MADLHVQFSHFWGCVIGVCDNFNEDRFLRSVFTPANLSAKIDGFKRPLFHTLIMYVAVFFLRLFKANSFTRIFFDQMIVKSRGLFHYQGLPLQVFYLLLFYRVLIVKIVKKLSWTIQQFRGKTFCQIVKKLSWTIQHLSLFIFHRTFSFLYFQVDIIFCNYVGIYFLFLLRHSSTIS